MTIYSKKIQKCKDTKTQRCQKCEALIFENDKMNLKNAILLQ